jgi:hypothetical protein
MCTVHDLQAGMISLHVSVFILPKFQFLTELQQFFGNF